MQNQYAGNAHLVNTYTHHTNEKIAKNGISVLPWTLLKLNGAFLDILWPTDNIEWVSVSRKTYEADNETVKKEVIIYNRLTKKDTLIVRVRPWDVVDETMVGQTISIDADQFLDLATLWAGIHFRVEKVAPGGKDLEVSILPADAEPPSTLINDDVIVPSDGATTLNLAQTPDPTKPIHLIVQQANPQLGNAYTIVWNTLVWDEAKAGYPLLAGYKVQLSYFY